MKKCFLVYKDGDGLHTVEVDTSVDIIFKNGFLKYDTPTEIVQDDLKNIVKIYFE